MDQQQLDEISCTAGCQICRERFAWDFLRDICNRMEGVERYAKKLERDLSDAVDVVQKSQESLDRCEASLSDSWEQLNMERLSHRAAQELLTAKLDEERLDHRAAQEDLNFERQRHQDTSDLLESVFGDAMSSAALAEDLAKQVALLKEAALGANEFSNTLKSPRPALQEASLTQENLSLLHASDSVKQRYKIDVGLGFANSRASESSDIATRVDGRELPSLRGDRITGNMNNRKRQRRGK